MIDWSDSSRQRLKISNHGPSIILQDGQRFPAGTEFELALPGTLFLGEVVISLFDMEASRKIDYALRTLPDWLHDVGINSATVNNCFGAPSSATLSSWLSTIASLHREPASSENLFKLAARSVFDPGGLDLGMVLMKQGEQWKIASSHVPRNQFNIAFDERVLNQVAQTKKTIYHDSELLQGIDDPTMLSCGALIASPVFDSRQKCVGAVYGSRSQHSQNNRRGIRPLEAQFLSLVADAISAGLARTQMEAEAARGQVLLEQAFPAEIAHELSTAPQSLQPKNHEVTIMFCDLREFTKISAEVSPDVTYDFLADVMDTFTEIVMSEYGVIIDYFGDGFSAFWNAPISQPDHPVLACLAAEKILQSMSAINQRWEPILGHQVRVGIGLHTGVSLVGNAGSHKRIKYGPLGTAVVMAQRIQDATKTAGVPILISEATAQRIQDDFLTLGVSKLPLKGFPEPQPLATLFSANESDSNLVSDCKNYELAFEAYETRDLQRANSLVSKIESTQLKPLAEYLMGLIEAAEQSETPETTHVETGSLTNSGEAVD